jgi:hypothetical protein
VSGGRLVLACGVAIAALAGCGSDSTQDQATSTVCDARDDIAKRVDSLKALTPATVTVDGVSTSLGAIGNDLSDIKNAQGDLSSDRQQQVSSATDTFTAEVKSIAGDLGRSVSVSTGKAELTAALDQLAASYGQTFAKIDCG